MRGRQSAPSRGACAREIDPGGPRGAARATRCSGRPPHREPPGEEAATARAGLPDFFSTRAPAPARRATGMLRTWRALRRERARRRGHTIPDGETPGAAVSRPGRPRPSPLQKPDPGECGREKEDGGEHIFALGHPGHRLDVNRMQRKDGGCQQRPRNPEAQEHAPEQQQASACSADVARVIGGGAARRAGARPRRLEWREGIVLLD